MFKRVAKLGSRRFAEFVEGSSHLTQDEVMNYSQVDFADESSSNDEGNGGANRISSLTDDESSDEIDLGDNEEESFR
jgi:hypothetical protein